MRKCTELRCKPEEKQLMSKFLSSMPNDGAWGTRKILWQEQVTQDDAISLKDLISKARAAQAGNDAESSGVRAFASGDANSGVIRGGR